MHGYFYTVKPARGGVLLNVSFTTSAFYKPVLVSGFLRDNETFGSVQKTHEALIGLMDADIAKLTSSLLSPLISVRTKKRIGVQRHLTEAILDRTSQGPSTITYWLEPELLRKPKRFMRFFAPADTILEADEMTSLGNCRAIQVRPDLTTVRVSTMPYPLVLYRDRNTSVEVEKDLTAEYPVGARGNDEISPRWNLINVRFLETGSAYSSVQPVVLFAPDLQSHHTVADYKTHIGQIVNFLGMANDVYTTEQANVEVLYGDRRFHFLYNFTSRTGSEFAAESARLR
ncbi:hypothetical protein E8E11_005057 [Didymella keratinophila]|nr:hypothetical protein E8E11_005057 [Didymella keratinophila]